jgi:hypothetical protein
MTCSFIACHAFMLNVKFWLKFHNILEIIKINSGFYKQTHLKTDGCKIFIRLYLFWARSLK